MTNSKNLRPSSFPKDTVAIAGTDDWIRAAIASRLRRRGLSVQDFGPGTSTIHRAGMLILVPQLVPRAGNPKRHVGLSSLAVTLAAAAGSGVDEVLLVSLVGADEKHSGHIGALGLVESTARTRTKSLTVVRATQVYGTMRNPGPFVTSARRALGRDRGSFGDLCCAPVFIGNLVDQVEAAVFNRITAGDVELAAPVRSRIRDVIPYFSTGPEGQHGFQSPKCLTTKWGPARRPDRALSELVELQSELVPNVSSPLHPAVHLLDPMRLPDPARNAGDSAQAA